MADPRDKPEDDTGEVARALLPHGEKVAAKRPDEGAVEIVRDHRAGSDADCRHFLPRHLHAHALRILRAAESAIRRLIVIAARDVVPRPAGGTWPPSSPPQRGGEVPKTRRSGGKAFASRPFRCSTR